MMRTCPTCKGSKECQQCNGEGTRSTRIGDIIFPGSPRTGCGHCGGIDENPGDGRCRDCEGTGTVEAK